MQNVQDENVHITNSVVMDIKVLRSNHEDMVSDRYKFDINDEILILSNECTKYYSAIDSENIDNNQKYFAIVYEKSFNPPIALINTLSSNALHVLNNVVTYSIVKISTSQVYKLVAIVKAYDVSNNLTNYISNNGALSVDILQDKLLSDLAKLISHCSMMDIHCGNINPNNIIVLSNGDFMLREFINVYSNYGQSEYYLAPEIVECAQYARRVDSTAADIYALGMTAFYALTATEPWMNYSDIEEFNKTRFERTIYKLLLNSHKKISEYYKLFFKGTLHEDINSRWNAQDVFDWLNGKVSKAPVFSSIVDNRNSITFNDHHYTTLKSIAYGMFCHNNIALQFLQEDKLFKWVKRFYEHQVNINDIYSEIKSINRHNINLLNLWLSKLLSKLDPQGSIRYNSLSITAKSIPDVLYYCMVTQKMSIVNRIMEIIHEQYWIVNDDVNFANTLNQNEALLILNISNKYSIKSHIYSYERITYSINIHAPCASPILSSEYVMNLDDLLHALDKLAAKNPKQFDIDRHIIAFAAAKLNLYKEDEIQLLKKVSNLFNNNLICGLCILNIAQQCAREINISKLCSVLTNKIIRLLNRHLHNVQTKNDFAKALDEASKSGQLSKVIHVLSNQNQFIHDHNGYNNALRNIRAIKHQIHELNLSNANNNNALFWGQKITVLFSYILCCILLVILMIK